jgi:phage terminase large subunit-like protein
MAKKELQRVPSMEELVTQISGALRKTSRSPTIYGYTPFPHQLPFHKSQARGRLFLGGNRAGKTVAGAAELVKLVTGTHEYCNRFTVPLRTRAIGVDFEHGIKKIIMPEIARWMPPSALKKGSWEESYDTRSRTLTLDNDSFIEFLTHDQDVDQHAGTSRHAIWFDEEPPELIFNENMLRLADVGGIWFMTMTPLIDMSWTINRIYNPVMNKETTDIEIFIGDTADNPLIEQGVLDVLMLGMSDEEKASRKKGTFGDFSHAIYNPVLANAIIDHDTIRSNWDHFYNEWHHFAMLDHGYTNPTAILFGCYDFEGKIVIYDEYYHTKRTVKENAEGFLEKVKEHKLESKLEYIVGDPSIRNTTPITGTSVQQEYADNGVYITLGNNDVYAGIMRVQGRMKEGLIRISNICEDTIREHRSYRWAKYASSKIEARNNRKEEPVKKDDHTCDALRYGVASRPMIPGEIDIPFTNVLNAPVAVGEVRLAIVDDFPTSQIDSEGRYYDETMGAFF